jgi:hypothetical protein
MTNKLMLSIPPNLERSFSIKETISNGLNTKSIERPFSRNNEETEEATHGTKYLKDEGVLICRTFSRKEKFLLGLLTIDIYIEDRYPDVEDGFDGKYKAFITLKAPFTERTFSFRMSYIGYLEVYK